MPPQSSVEIKDGKKTCPKCKNNFKLAHGGYKRHRKFVCHLDPGEIDPEFGDNNLQTSNKDQPSTSKGHNEDLDTSAEAQNDINDIVDGFAFQ